MGALCGYYGVMENHPYWEIDYNEIRGVDQELTFAGKYKGISDEIWFLGFDCGHYTDMVPKMLNCFSIRRGFRGPGTYRNIQYVINELETLGKQLKHDFRN